MEKLEQSQISYLKSLDELIESNKRIIEIQERIIKNYDLLIEMKKKEISNQP